MQNYRNLNGDSPIAEYESGTDYIKVRYRTGQIYVYDHHKAGSGHVAEMQRIAEVGRGLSAYIKRNCNKLYSRKEGG